MGGGAVSRGLDDVVRIIEAMGPLERSFAVARAKDLCRLEKKAIAARVGSIQRSAYGAAAKAVLDHCALAAAVQVESETSKVQARVVTILVAATERLITLLPTIMGLLA